MEQARLFIAIALSFLIFFAWEIFFVDNDAEKRQDPAREYSQVEKDKEYLPDIKEKIFEQKPMNSKQVMQEATNARVIIVNTPLYTVKISEKGAILNSIVLKKFNVSSDKDSPLLDIMQPDLYPGTVATSFHGAGIQNLEDAVYHADLTYEVIDVFDTPGEITFSWTSPQNVVVDKKFSFSPETYLIGLDISVKNGSDQNIQGNLVLSLSGDSNSGKNGYGFTGPSVFLDNKLEQIKIKKIKDKSLYTGKITWIAIQNRYFFSSIIPVEHLEAAMKLSVQPDTVLKADYIQPDVVINSGMMHDFQYHLAFGPKKISVLGQLGHNLNKIMNFGMFDFIAKPCLRIMNWLYKYIPNYGMDIIILTIFIKLILWPLGSKSYKSMSEMKKLQPLMNQLREKYKGDKQRMNQEIMGLYKTYKVNPMGGCLPMLVQIPIFFAFYRMLYEAIELRHAPFFGWINDLSAPDRLFNFSFSIPFMQPPYGIPVLTIIMGGTMFLQQKMSPPMGDPTQAKMMMFMPIVFTVIFINFSSGLVLYWLVNNILSVSQQYYIQKKNA